MAMKNFDAKQFLLEKGERVGLGIAVSLMVLLILGNLFMPSHGFFSASPKENAKKLQDVTAQKQRLLNPAFNKPSESDLPKKDDVQQVLSQVDPKPIDPALYAVAGLLFEPRDVGSTTRRLPDVLLPEEGYAEAGHIRIPVCIFGEASGKPAVLVLQNDGGSGPAGGPPMGGLQSMGKMYQRGQFPTSSMRGGMMPGGPGGRMMPPGAQFGQPRDAESNAKEMKTQFVPLDKLGETGFEPAVQVRPLRIAEIGASFPLRKQIEEFQAKLRLASPAAVREEPAITPAKEKDKDAADQQQPEAEHSFRFVGVLVERCVVDPRTGKPLSEWGPINLEDNFKPFIYLTGVDKVEPDDPKYDPVFEDGLVMQRLKLFHEK